ncbi:MATE family efflux transporter [Anaerotignum sp.]|uniref:MATE family efflux transporter n=2 Tax=Anaerotignum sp. TaxID=2039241 RepID=UPI0029D644BC|nr:MATE family efflux transporter [Anaerotignum sp.]MCI6056586.1 MATE family efflux transporter [Clostridia bacterium]MDY3595093.1 MATE family efflux transporter [Anaerotignum sp.]
MQQQRTLTMDGENPLGVRPIKGLLFSFSIPAIISCLVNSVYNIVDQIFIGQGVGYLGNAATTIAFPLMTIIMAFATLIGSGGSAYAALRLGEGRKREALLTLNNLLVIAIGLGILLAAAGLIFLKPILTLFGATETTMPYAIDYTSIVLIGVPFSMVSIALSSMARTDGHPRMSMYGILIGAALNTVLDPIYIFVLDWGVKGAAIATVTAQFVSTVVLCYYFLKKGRMRFTRRYMKPVGRVWYKIFSLGISSGITALVACIMQVVMNNSLVYYGNQTEITGDVALSAMGIVMKIAMILASVCIGFGIGAQPILGFNLGAKKYARVRHTYLLAVSIATASILIGWAVCQLAPHLVLSLFGKENQTFTDFAVRCLRIYLGGIFCAGFQIVSTNYFQATGQPLKASLLSMLRQLILLIPMLLILPLFFGLNGLLYAGPCADIGSAVIVALFILPEMRKLNRKIAESQGPALAA